ncbi:hypothetical protein [Sinorhizobium fredii]|uniref:hypothetical protein n=1 Tax=Rhizobium fredii TaxID=380 RepID=UPI00056705D8|nr:hypothetical protein [Sinorhizobium fredii]
MFRTTAFAVAFGFCGMAQANEEAIARFKDYLPQQIKELPEKDRSSVVPMMFIGAANLAMSEFGDLVIQANLNSLMYNGLADYEGAKKDFQKDLGEEPTGDLTVWQIHTLGYRSSRLNLTHVSFFTFDYGGILSNGRASVKGTVKIIGERIAYPINHTVIECFQTEGYCNYRQIALVLPDEKSWVQSYSVMQVANDYYKITRWENDQIDAVPYNSTACRINQLSLNFATKEYFEIARNNTAGDCDTGLGVKLPRLDKPRVSQIVDGREIVDAEYKRIDEEARGYLSSAFRKRLGSIKTKR